MNSVKIQSISYQFHTWSELGSDIFNLSKSISNSGLQFDRLVALAKGGLAFSRSLADYLNIQQVSTIYIEFYAGIHQTQNLPVITQSLPVDIRNEKILLFDDLVDSGKTMELAKTYIEQHGAKSVHIATFFMKPQSIIKPDFYVSETTDWIIFPNEIRETINQLHNNWKDQGLSETNIQENLMKIGIPKDQVDFYLKETIK